MNDPSSNGESAKQGWIQVTSYLIQSFVKNLITVCLLLFCFKYVMENLKLDDIIDKKFKFEVKSAREVKTRLSDVKGIDEIKAEVEDLIKMLTQPNKYREKGAKLHKGVLLFG